MSAGDQNYHQLLVQQYAQIQQWGQQASDCGTAAVAGKACLPRPNCPETVGNLVDAYARMQGRLDAYGALEITFPEDLEEEMASLARKAKAAHREAQEAERQALREEIRALQSKEQKRKDAEAKLAALEEKLK